MIRLFCIVLLFGTSSALFSQKTTTNLKEESQIQTFLKVTEKIRCICLPSLPIQSCSFNMCAASSYLKTFIENRIKDGMGEEEIISKMENGFGNSILQDPIVLMFQENGNQGMVDSLVYGFGPKILAKPDDTWINATLLGLGVLGLYGIYRYGTKKVRGNSIPNQTSNRNDPNSKEKLSAKTDAIKEKIRKFEES
ncbi:cytochrome C biogenesis protein [Leptospira yanagawae serovar Saopaulo str. Sao Paulo = ATCC 700523]|uniref:Cytochrome c-type biogenesis protein n=2 Tax=Leptospira yanagawae TaxID=293069 RepID=A0ABY2M2W2_9LEPT|nr:cytochrome c-type biogenesis protein CcmH [Leptospira yanagawae]EOQ89629.1 cytochrome C biogenesis protein [Leptospira yanagawae serovar Saopaulo str. Sao Paulo = ATCC 700523]TGL22400.1 cytochrome C biogenesis protein [Leptospira yanagawae]